MKKFLHANFEFVVWTSALVCIWFMNPEQHGFSFCVFKMIGVPWCPGCGVSHAMAYAMHGDFAASFNEHAFGAPALIIILHRIFILYKINLTTSKN